MFNAFKVGVTVQLTNMVSTGLMQMSRQFNRASADVRRLQKELNTVQMMQKLGLVGGTAATNQIASLTTQIAAATGAAAAFNAQMAKAGGLLTRGLVGVSVARVGFGAVGKILDVGEEWQTRKNQLRMVITDQKEFRESLRRSQEVSSEVMTASWADSAGTFLDLYNLLGSRKEAEAILPGVLRFEAVLRAAGMDASAARGQGFGLAKIVDLLGRSNSAEEVDALIEKIGKVSIATGGRVDTNVFLQNLKYMRAAKYGLSDDFLFGVAPTLMIDLLSKQGGAGGHGGIGTLLQAHHRTLVQGQMNKVTLANLTKLGLISGGALATTTTGTVAKGPIRGLDLARSDPYRWIHEVLIPSVERASGKTYRTDAELRTFATEILPMIFKERATALDFWAQLTLRKSAIERDRRLYSKTMGPAAAFEMLMRLDPHTIKGAFVKQKSNLYSALGDAMYPVITPAIGLAANAMGKLAGFLGENKTAALLFAGALVTLSAAFGLAGVVSLAKLGAFMWTFSGVGATVAAGTAAVAAALGLPVWLTLGTVAVGVVALAGALIVLEEAASGRLNTPATAAPSWSAIAAGGPFGWPLVSALSGGLRGMFAGGSAPVPTPMPYGQELVLAPVVLNGEKVGEAMVGYVGRKAEMDPLGPAAFDATMFGAGFAPAF